MSVTLEKYFMQFKNTTTTEQVSKGGGANLKERTIFAKFKKDKGR